MYALKIKDLLEGREDELGLAHIAGKAGLVREITHVHPQRPGENDTFPDEILPENILIITPEDISKHLVASPATQEKFCQAIISSRIPCVALSETIRPPEFLLSFSESRSVPVISSIYDEFLLESRLTGILRERIENIVTIHGVLLNVYGLGLIITGDSGVGKTECAVRLVAKGHMWIADDFIEIEKRDGTVLWGRAYGASRGLLEKDGRGIVSAREMFGEERILEETKVSLMVQLERTHDVTGETGRFSMDEPHEIMGVKIPYLRIHVSSNDDFPDRQIDESVRFFVERGGAV